MSDETDWGEVAFTAVCICPSILMIAYLIWQVIR